MDEQRTEQLTPDPDNDTPNDTKPGRQKQLLIGGAVAAGVIIVGLVVALIIALSGGDSDTPKKASGPDPEYVGQVRAPLTRLGSSAEVTARSLAVASRPRDVAKVARTARQQLVLVQSMRARLANVPRTAGTRQVSGQLSRATQAHRQYLITLSRVSSLPADRALKTLPGARAQARRALAAYNAAGRQMPGTVGAITSAGLADVSGLRTALQAKVADEARAAREAQEAAAARERERQDALRRQQQAAAPASSGVNTDTRRGPVFSSVTASDGGSMIHVNASYCDRTPGYHNNMTYTFSISGQGTSASESQSVTTSWACRDISQSFADGFPYGQYTATVTVQNHTNNVSASSSTTFHVVD